jgi:hypothetical protein
MKCAFNPFTGIFEFLEDSLTDHGLLAGLGDDDHTQYHTDARGDARYSLLAHGHAHSALTGLTSGDDHTQYTLLVGRSGGQTIIGGTVSANNLTLQSTSHATKGKIILGTLSAYDQANDRFGLGNTAPTEKLDITSGNILLGSGHVRNAWAAGDIVMHHVQYADGSQYDFGMKFNSRTLSLFAKAPDGNPAVQVLVGTTPSIVWNVQSNATTTYKFIIGTDNSSANFRAIAELGDTIYSGFKVSSNSSYVNIPYPGTQAESGCLLTSRGFSFSTDGAVISTNYATSFGIGVAISRSGVSCISVGNALGYSILVESGNVGLFTYQPTKNIGIGGNSARTIGLERHTTANTAGNALTINAGGATASATDKNGGQLILQGGQATGTGESGVTLQGCVAGATGTADRSFQDMVKVLGDKLGFYNSTPVTKPTVSGSRGGNSALASLLTALANQGLIVDSSTA